MAAGGMSPAAKLERARARLMMESPWLGTLAASIALVPDENLMAFEADGERLRYRPGVFDEAGVEVLEFVLANAALHRALEHGERRGRRNPRLWQQATDHAINALLAENGFFLPDFARGYERYGSRYAEEIYEELLAENPPTDDEERSEEEDALADERARKRKNPGEAAPERSKAEELFEERQALQQQLDDETIRRITERYLEEGALPEGIERLMPELKRKASDWRQELHRYFDPFVKNDYRFSPPNLKHLYRGVSLPALNSERLSIAVAIDSSGSVDQETMGSFLAEIDAIMEQFPDYQIDLIAADDRIRFHRRFETGELLECEPEGGGGTDFRPVFDYIDRAMDPPQALLYFTDGAGIFPTEEPRYEVLWVLSREAEPPFGEKILLESAEPI